MRVARWEEKIKNSGGRGEEGGWGGERDEGTGRSGIGDGVGVGVHRRKSTKRTTH